MRSLDLYSEKTMRDASPDKIAASQQLLHEANGLCLSSITADARFAVAAAVQVRPAAACSVFLAIVL